MASGRQERVYHQDYIARIRYSNTLPPPPIPPKLLDIPGTGLSSGHYTSAAFASRLAREQPLNIEADAELGMPIDLVGIPGVFDGDESAIMMRGPPPPIHPKDKALLRPLNTLGKPNSGNASAAFLRRTEYISSNQSQQRFESSTSKDLLRLRNDPKRRPKKNLNKEDPRNILRHVIKGFDVAYPRDAYTGDDTSERFRGAEVTTADNKAWSDPKHPKNPQLKLLDSYPVLPDLDACPTVDNYVLVKFQKDPASSAEYDQRLDVAMLKPRDFDDDKYQDKMAAYEEDLRMPKPTMEFDYDFFMADNPGAVRGIKRKFDANDQDNEDDDLYTFTDPETGKSCFKYDYVRTYETYQQAGDLDNAFGDSVAMALHDPEMAASRSVGRSKPLQKAAYFYPIIHRSFLRSKRKAAGAMYEEAQHIDGLRVTARDANEQELKRRLVARSKLDTTISVPADEPSEAQGEPQNGDSAEIVGEDA